MEELQEKNKFKLYVLQMVILFMLIIGASIMLILDPMNSTYYTSIISLIIGVLVPNPDHNLIKL